MFSLQKEFDSKPIYLIHKTNFDNWLSQQDSLVKISLNSLLIRK